MPRHSSTHPAQYRLTRTQPPVSFDDLALMLELDLLLGRRQDFTRRLQRALRAAARQQHTTGRRRKASW